MHPRLLLLIMGWCFAIVAWQTFAYPPEYLLGAAVWGTIAVLGAVTCVCTAFATRRGFALIAGIACICHAIGRSTAIVIQISFRERFGLGAPFSNYAIAATVWTLIAVLIFVAWSHFVIPWSVVRRVVRGGS
tara:strand:+ start:74 stop:469 length:396 start_codon:yes stop_codon:yes gene_type:complete